jgi:ceramide kinase
LDPLSFKFVEHHKVDIPFVLFNILWLNLIELSYLQTPAFTFISSHDESIWNLDGEMFQASEVSVQACRGLVNLFASGPEV